MGWYQKQEVQVAYSVSDVEKGVGELNSIQHTDSGRIKLKCFG